MSLKLLCLFGLLSHAVATSKLSTVVGTTAAHGTTGYITTKVDLEPIFLTAQHALDVLEHATSVLTNDTNTLTTYATDIVQTMVNINHLIQRSAPKRDAYDFVPPPLTHDTLEEFLQAFDQITPNRPLLPVILSTPPPLPRSDDYTDMMAPHTVIGDTTLAPSFTFREKRSAGLIEGFIAISNLADSVFKWFVRLTHQSDITTLKYKVEAITHALITTQTKVNDALFAYKKMAIRITEIEIELNHIKTLTHVIEIATHTSMILRQIYLALLELKQNRLPLDIIQPKELSTAHHTISLDMESDNLSPVLTSDLLYEVPVEALYKPLEGLYIFIPVYAVKQNSLMNLHRFNHVPIHVSDSTLMTLDIEYPYIALAIDDNTVGKVFTQNELDNCFVINDFYHCPTKNYVRTDLTDLCVYNLLIENKQGILDTCKVSFEKERSQVYQIAGNDFIVFSAQPDELILKCKKDDNETVTQFEYSNSVAFSLNRTCPEATTSRYKFNYQSSHHTHSQILCDPLPLNESIIGQIIPTLSDPLAATLPDMGTFDLSDFDTPPHAQVYLQIAVTWLKDYAFIIVSISFTYVLCHTIYCCRSKVNRNPQRLAYEDQLRVALKA